MTPPPPDAAPALAIVELRCQVPRGVLAWRSGAPYVADRPGRRAWPRGVRDRGLGAGRFRVRIRDDRVDGPEQLGVRARGRTCGAARSASSGSGSARRRVDGLEPVLRVEAGLLSAADWSASAITPRTTRDARRRRRLRCFGASSTSPRSIGRLYVTSLGLHRLAVNGRDAATTSRRAGRPYRHRLTVETYDVTRLLKPGANVLSAVLGDGWYRGRLGWGGLRAVYGGDVALIAQLEIDPGTERRCVSSRTRPGWRRRARSLPTCTTAAVVDLREQQPGWTNAGFDTAGWRPAAVVPFDATILEPRIGPRSGSSRRCRPRSDVATRGA